MASSMSYNGGDSLPLSFTRGYELVAVSLVVLYVVVMYGLFGSIWPPHVVDMYNKKTVILKRYNELFQSRENMLYHIAWSKERGELNESKRMQRQLVEVDLDIDAIEEEYGTLIGVPSRKKAKDTDNTKNI